MDEVNRGIVHRDVPPPTTRKGKVLVCNSILCAGAGSSNLLSRAQQLAAVTDAFTVGETDCLGACHGIGTPPWPLHTPAVYLRGPRAEGQLCPRACFDRDIEDLARGCRAVGIYVPRQATALVAPSSVRAPVCHWARDARLVGRHYRRVALPYAGILVGCLGLQVAARLAVPADPYHDVLRQVAKWGAFYGPCAIFLSLITTVARRAISPYERVKAAVRRRQRMA